MSTFSTIIFTQSEGIARITLNRPQRLNALTDTMTRELAEALDELAADKEARVLIVTGAGRGFCSGRDYSQVAAGERETKKTTESQPRVASAAITLKLIGLEIPTIAMVNGAAVGGGFDYALACDIRTGSEHARFQMTALRRGNMTGMGSSWLLPRMVGLGNAALLTLTADFLEAKEAYRMGVLQRLVPAAELETATMELAHRLAGLPTLALREAKRLLYRGLHMDLEASLDYAATSLRFLATTADFHEGASAFQERRAADFQGR